MVPVKAFHAAKARLTPVLDEPSRARLARAMAARVLSAAGPTQRYVVCDDDGVADWAASLGHTVVWTPGQGLNGAVTIGVAQALDEGATRVVVAHADLPLASTFEPVLNGPLTLVPDRRLDGTNVISLPAGAAARDFTFSYGPGSFGRHRHNALLLGEVGVIHIDELSFDLDTPEDFRQWISLSTSTPQP